LDLGEGRRCPKKIIVEYYMSTAKLAVTIFELDVFGANNLINIE